MNEDQNHVPAQQPVTNEEPTVDPVTTTPQVPEGPANEPAPQQKASTTARVGAVLLVLTGLVIGFFIGAFINFGACWKSECNVFEESAPLLVPAASLILTIPGARGMLYKSKDRSKK